MNFDKGFSPCDILLPAPETDLKAWAVIACDQYTSQRDYWDAVEYEVGDKPSTLRLIQPEIDLDKAEARLGEVRRDMKDYLEKGILTCRVRDGFVLTVRRTAEGLRPGLIGKVDLDAYDFTPGSRKPVRATEGTILERIPPRVKIREGAPVEFPHIMLLADDPDETLTEPVLRRAESLRPLYDFELMLGGGHLTGYAVEDAQMLDRIDRALDDLYERNGGFLLAAGDGNHSLATAKACWEKRKAGLTEEQKKNDPARYALAEIVNLHCPALLFHPIHRVVFGADRESLLKAFDEWLKVRGMALREGGRICIGGRDVSIEGGGDVLDTVYLQPFLDEYLNRHPEASVDYVHGEAALAEVAARTGGVAIRLGTISKEALFPSVEAGGVLPRKSFSMGEADEKRFYMEGRRIL